LPPGQIFFGKYRWNLTKLKVCCQDACVINYADSIAVIKFDDNVTIFDDLVITFDDEKNQKAAAYCWGFSDSGCSSARTVGRHYVETLPKE